MLPCSWVVPLPTTCSGAPFPQAVSLSCSVSLAVFCWALNPHLTESVIVTGLANSLVAPERRDQDRRIPEAPSPRMITTARSISTSASNDYPPSRYEDLKTEQIRSSTAFIQPREVPMPGQPQRTSQGQALPNITNAVMGGQGVGGLSVQGQLFPPLRASTDPVPPRAQVSRDNSKKSFFDSFDSAKAPARAVTVGKLAISNPVLQEGGSNPLDKVATMDLAMAAQLEKDRRALMAMQNQPTPLGRVDTGVAPERGLERAMTAVREGISDWVEPSQLESRSAATGFATGAQLSPAGDELRRRSPRQAPSDTADKQSTKSSALSEETSRTPSPPPKSAARALPEQNKYGANGVIRPSRQLPPSPEPQIEPVKTPLQRRPTAGLPGNPRALSVKKKSPPETLKGRQETVMFVNNIVYDDPNYVANVMEEARERGPKPPPPAPITTTVTASTDELPLVPDAPPTAASIVHRPRPIPRKNLEEGEGTFYPPIGHKRSKSAGNVIQRRTILQSNPGSPTTLPPLPPPPQPPQPLVNTTRPLPNNTKSMTFDEKVNYLFPQPKGADKPERRSSVPGVVGSFMSDSPTLTEFEDQDPGFRDSNKSMESLRTRSIFSDQDRGQLREVSLAAYQGLIDESDGRGQGESPTDGNLRTNGAKRASSPVLPIFGDIRSASSMSHDDDIATNLGSVYSPLPVQQVGLAVHQARAIEVVRLDRPLDDRAVSAVTNSEEMTIMLDTSIAREVHQGQGEDGLSSPVDDGSPVEETTSTRSSGPWHRRVGDETLSFSMLSDKRNSRRGPPPTPLSLSSRPTPAKQAALVQAAEPSPLPSPEEALQMIQNQLKRYEQADRGSTESPGRLALLNDLEMEMGQQETRWLGMQHEFSRDSLSTLDMNSPTGGSRRTSAVVIASAEELLSRNSSMRSNASADRRASRRTRLASIVSTGSLALEGGDVPFGSRASLWQKRLAEAHLEYMEHELDRKRSINFLSLSSNLGSPTPPDSEESEIEIESRRNLEALLAARNEQVVPMPKAGLWTAPQALEDRSGLMWVRPEKPYHVNTVEPPLPGLSVRPAQRKESSELTIDMGQLLWEKPASISTHSFGLWKSSTEIHNAEEIEPKPEPRISKFYNPGLQRSRTVPSSRPLTQRPPRRSRRITALPDILEDPQPLPDKRDTLGIFQFPWGEKSDIPSVPTRPSFMAMPGTMSTGGSNGRSALDMRSRQLEESEYSSSFFDDYDDEDEDGNSDDSSEMGSDSDDGFDETTLFEIASLLQASRTDVPSTNSIFGPSRDPVDSFIDEYGFEQEQSDESTRQTMLVDIEEGIEGLQEMPSPMPHRPVSLWVTSEKEERGAHGKGLPQPDDWHTYDETMQTIRARPRVTEQQASVASDNLWVLPPLKTNTSKSPMWTPPESPKPSSSASESAQPQPTSPNDYPEPSTPILSRASMDGPLLWQAKEQSQKGDHGVGLPHPQGWENYDSNKATIRAKPRRSEPVVIESVSLWAAPTTEPSTMPSNMWTPKFKSAPVTRVPSPVSKVVNEAKPSVQLLWSAPASPTQMADSTLFDPNSGRTDFNTTTQAPAALQMERKPRSPVKKPLDRLTSNALWASAAPTKTETNWLFFESSPKNLLWSVPSPKKDTTSGLYDPRSGRSDFRSTSQAPAAIDIIRKPRSSEKESLQQLTSTTLWTANTTPDLGRNWIIPSRSSKPETPENVLLTETRKASLRQAIAASLLRAKPVPNELWNDALDQALAACSSGGSAEATVPSTSRDVALQAAISSSLLRVKAVPAQRWQEALEQAIAASYPASQTVADEVPVKRGIEERAAPLAEEAAAQSFDEAFDVTKRHPVFAASSLTSKASMIHPAATGYTADVAAVHPVYFGSGTGVFAHPAMPSKTSKLIRAFNAAARASNMFGPGTTAVLEEAPRPTLTRQASQRGRVSRISAMVSMFEDPTRSRSVSRGASVEPETRRPTVPTRPATPEPPAQNEEVVPKQGREANPELLSQIVALEQGRMFAEQWATRSFEAVQDAAVDERGPLEPSPVFLPATQYAPSTLAQPQPSLADQLEHDLFTPNTPEAPTAPRSVEFRAEEAPLTIATQAQPMSADELAAELLTPEDATPFNPFASSAGTTEPERFASVGWMLPPTGRTEAHAPQQESQLSRSDTVKSAVSALSETDPERGTLRDSLVSVDSERGRKPAGSQIQFIY